MAASPGLAQKRSCRCLPCHGVTKVVEESALHIRSFHLLPASSPRWPLGATDTSRLVRWKDLQRRSGTKLSVPLYVI